MKKNQNGFTIVEVIIVVALVGLIGFVAWKALTREDKPSSSSQPSASSQPSEKPTESAPAQLIWQQSESGWRSMQTPPACPSQPMMKAPADISKATAVLYPGQTRGGNYKPHGGFRFDTSTDNAIKVTAPIDGYLVRGGSYIAEGEVQYTFDAMNNCGVMYRVGHLRELPADLQKIADTWPAPSASSATHSVNPPVYVKQGAVLGTKVGLLKSNNTFFDLGVYDYRQPNEASKSPAYQSAHSQDKELSWQAVCWLDGWLPASDQAKLKALPAGDPTSGKTSDYCK
jgi:prepilin-type N-terminal cleavage/methylation domain-containing protein